MRTVEEVRRIRLGMLRERLGTLAELNERLGLLRRDSTLSQILNSSRSSSGSTKIMGSELARRIETTFDLEVGWMDTDPAYDNAAQRLSQEAMQLAREFDRRSEPERQAMITLWRTLTEVAGHAAGTPPPAAAADAGQQQGNPGLARKRS
jgi:hypothetical protein